MKRAILAMIAMALFAGIASAGPSITSQPDGNDGAGSGDLVSTNNLSDLDNAATARTNLGIDTAANLETSLSLGAFASDLLGYANAAAVLSGIGAEGDLSNEAGLYSALSDVSDFVQPGDVVRTAASANPTTDAEGEIAYDSDDDMFEVFDTALNLSVAVPIRFEKSLTIFEPDQVNDEIPFFKVDAAIYPHGVTITQLSITIPSDAAYSMVFEEWAGDPPTAQNDMHTVTTGGADSYMENTPTDGALDADDYVFLHVPDTDVDWINVQVIGYANEGD